MVTNCFFFQHLTNFPTIYIFYFFKLGGGAQTGGARAIAPYAPYKSNPANPSFDRACSSAISDREGAHRSYQASPSELTHAAFISAKNCCSAKIRRPIHLSVKGKLISSTLLPPKKVSGSYPKRSTTSVTPASRSHDFLGKFRFQGQEQDELPSLAIEIALISCKPVLLLGDCKASVR